MLGFRWGWIGKRPELTWRAGRRPTLHVEREQLHTPLPLPPPCKSGPGMDDAHTAAAHRRGHVARPVLLTVAVGVVALNLRPAITSVGPVLNGIEHATGLTAATAGLLTTLPVLAFGLCSPLAPLIARRYGIEATVAGSLVLLVAGLALRAVPSAGVLFVGTTAAGVAIAAGNVLVPALIKRDFALRARMVTGVYSVALSAGAALAAGVTVPLIRAFGQGWRGGLALWALPGAIALVLWMLATAGSRHVIAPAHVSTRLWRDRLAWHVTVFMGLQSLGYYALVAWLPTIFEQRGVSASTAGWLLSLSGLASLPTAFGAPLLASTPGRARLVVGATVVANAVALGGLLWHPVAGALAWMVLLGLAQGAAIALALHFIVARAPSSLRAAELSGMAQTVGYLLASVGPFLLGALRDATRSWTLALVVLLVALVPELTSGLGAGRSGHVGERSSPRWPGGSPPAADPTTRGAVAPATGSTSGT